MILSSLSESFVGKVVLFQTVMLLMGTVLTVVYLYLRNTWRQHESHKKDVFTEEIIQRLFVNSRFIAKPFLTWWDRAIYRDILLAQIKVLSGQEREVMVQHYIEMNFLATDQEEVRSRYWWRRLRALIRVDVLALSNSREIYLKAINDANTLVALEATRALSRLPQNVSPAILFSSLERVGLKRQTALLEVINNIGSYYSVDTICDYLKQSVKHSQNEEMSIACVQVLGDLRAYQALPLLQEVLLKPETHSVFYLVKVLDAVSLISDPELIVLVRPLLQHPSSQVRARALNTLAALGDEQIYLNLETLKMSDSDVEVQRVIQKIQKSAA